MHRAGAKHIVRHMQKSGVQWSVISKFTCTTTTITTTTSTATTTTTINTQYDYNKTYASIFKPGFRNWVPKIGSCKILGRPNF